MADTPNGETVIPEAPSNTPVQTPAATPVANAGDTAEVERLKKEAEQARLRANQLENELKKKNDAEAEAQRLKLEQEQDINTKLETEQKKREDLERKIEEREENEALQKASQEALKDYPSDIKEQAKELGISLTSTDEDDVKAFTEKLDKLTTAMSNSGNVRPNNGRPATPDNGVTQNDIRAAAGDPEKIAELMRKRNPQGVTAQMTQAR